MDFVFFLFVSHAYSIPMKEVARYSRCEVFEASCPTRSIVVEGQKNKHFNGRCASFVVGVSGLQSWFEK